MFYIGLAVGIMLGGLCGVAYMALAITGKREGERVAEPCSKDCCTKACKAWNVCDEKW